MMSADYKQGDWECYACGFHNFASRSSCKECGRQKKGGSRQEKQIKGDWNCGDCRILNFASRDRCFKCFKAKDPNTGIDPNTLFPLEQEEQEVREGDWFCVSCNEHNFASRFRCRKCDQAKVTQEVDTQNKQSDQDYTQHRGFTVIKHIITKKQDTEEQQINQKSHNDWDCYECGAENFGFRIECFKCGHQLRKYILDDQETGQNRGRDQDWNCFDCKTVNFSYRKECFKCGHQLNNRKGRVTNFQYRRDDRSRDQLKKEGDWTCFDCGYSNFERRQNCHKCNYHKL